MTSDERALLRAVCAAPDDDLPRLVYADWLDEHDRPERAEFIRAQCELAALTEDSPRRRQLAFRCRELLDTYAAEWIQPNKLQGHQCRFRRGFIEAADLSAVDLSAFAAHLFETSPVRRVQLRDLEGEVDSLQWIPKQNSITSLDLIANDLDADALRDLAGFKRFARLRELSLMFNMLGDDAIRPLCDRALFQQLSKLKLGANPFSDAGRLRLQDHFGQQLTFECRRDEEHLYTLLDSDRVFRTGYATGMTQLFLVEASRETALAVFDHAGNLLRTEYRDHPPDGTHNWDASSEFCEKWLTELGFTPSAIHVKRFLFRDEVGIDDFVPTWIDDFEDPTSDEVEASNEAMKNWLARGQFRFIWDGEDWWLNRDGEVTDT